MIGWLRRSCARSMRHNASANGRRLPHRPDPEPPILHPICPLLAAALSIFELRLLL
jgi:hypothetical protein